MTGKLKHDEFLHRASRLEGQQLTTAARKAAFRIRVTPTGFEITPESTGRPRTVPASRIDRFLDAYSQSGTRRPGDYREITFDASYLLAVLSRIEMEGS